MMDFTDILRHKISVPLLIESMAEGIVFINQKGTILMVNHATNELFGYPEKELIGQCIDVLLPNKYKQNHKKHLQDYFSAPKVRSMGHTNSTVSGIKKDGSQVPLEISLSFFKAENEPIGLAFITDISARVKAENELKSRNIELDAFAHTIAHELHSQLNSVIGFSQLLLKKPDLSNEKKNSFLEMTVSSAYKMNQIIQEILLFSTLKKEEVKKTPLAMENIIKEALSRISDSEKADSKIYVAKQFETSLGYGPWIEEVWYNYIQNAIKYGGTPPKIEIGSSKTENGYSKFWVKDNGLGLNEEQCKLVFTEPQKLSQTHIQGHGIGLSIVQRIVQKLDGRVQVESSPNKGSTFSFYLPNS
ncbi:PAS domain S-box protein [Labilibaculum sp.]|uniref:PAS domain-containing sensor histidine kinase n=1 Tax=Labilibaculum sp. TaxID=2060723 RepID=UPI00356622B1